MNSQARLTSLAPISLASRMKPALPKHILWALLFVVQLPMLSIYALRLVRDPIYGWLTFATPLAALLLFALRWDRRLENPSHPMAVLGLALGLVAILASAILRNDWLAGLGLICTTGAFLGSHHQRDGLRLLPIWYVMWSMLTIPMGGNSQLTQSFVARLEASSKSLLRLAQIPYIDFANAIEVPNLRIYFDQQVYSWLSWPLFVALALFYSAWKRRTWFEGVLNLLSALFWYFALQCGLILSCVRWSVAPDTWHMWLLIVLWGAIAWGLFLSTERGLRILLQPISESTADSRLVNPFVLAWNWCFSPRDHRSSKWQIGESWFGRTTSLVVLGCVVLTLILQLVQSSRGLAAMSAARPVKLDLGELQAFVFKKGEVFDYRHTHYAPPLVRDMEVDLWTVFAPLSTSEHIFTRLPQRVFDLKQIIVEEGWQVDKLEQVPAKLPNGEWLTYGSAAIHNGRQHAQLLYAWLNSDGSPLELADTASRGYLLMSKAELVEIYAAATKSTLEAEFSRLVVGVQTQLNQALAAP